MRNIGKHAAKLQELTAVNCVLLTDKGVDDVAKGCQALRKLCLKKCKELTGKSLKSVSDHCNELQELDVTGCPALGVNDKRRFKDTFSKCKFFHDA